ncbi:MFS transporter [Acidisphaera sp. S103]|uniref:MFS transporter n=1 Tax=Acidisphaera sp. S103 TaxID=1747223 RepID=UPI001C209A15|nr:MFS transporter [Acidisphaera sp. S103]
MLPDSLVRRVNEQPGEDTGIRSTAGKQALNPEAAVDRHTLSLRGLDGINLLMADVRDGVGPFLSVFLKASRHWDPGAIGLAMGASSIAAALCQVPAGLLVDGTHAKRLLIAGSGLMVGVGCLVIVAVPRFWAVIAAQAVLGSASAVIPPAIAALSLGLVGRRLLDARISRNEGFNHAGNLSAAVLAGTLGHYFGTNWIFYLVCAFALASAAIVALIDPKAIDHEQARGGEDPNHNGEPIRFRELLRRRDLMIFLASVVLFHFGNAAMLPMAGQVLAQTHPGSDTIALSACIIAAQFVMVGVAWGVGQASARGIGRKPIFLVALAVLPVRGLLFSVTVSPYAVVGIQLLDGVAAGIFGVISVLIASDLMRGTGRFNLAQGLMALAVGVGATLSNATAGFVVQWFGYADGFLYLAAIAGCALVFFALLMPETKATADASPRAEVA